MCDRFCYGLSLGVTKAALLCLSFQKLLPFLIRLLPGTGRFLRQADSILELLFAPGGSFGTGFPLPVQRLER